MNSLQCSRVSTVKSPVLWVVTQCTVLGRHRCFGRNKPILTFSQQTLKKEAKFSAETSVSTHKSTLCHNPAEHNQLHDYYNYRVSGHYASSCFYLIYFIYDYYLDSIAFLLWFILWFCWHLYCMKSNGKIIGKWRIGKGLERSGLFAWRHRVKRRKTSVRLADVPSEIRTKYILNKSLDCHR
jgi:hypothetical protein